MIFCCLSLIHSPLINVYLTQSHSNLSLVLETGRNLLSLGQLELLELRQAHQLVDNRPPIGPLLGHEHVKHCLVSH